jgi:uncharacterized protein (TIGR03083 family)
MSRGQTDGGRVDYLAAIAHHSSGLADAAEGNLDADVAHCPGWTVADLVHHLTTTHWFWSTIVQEQLGAPPPDDRRPPREPREQLIAAGRRQADRLVRVLASADRMAEVYTWAPQQHTVAFVVRHQVQEAAVHHWDAVHASGGQLEIAAPYAVDAIEEFLTVSVSSMVDPADPVRPALAGQLVLRCTDADRAWTIRDDTAPGTVAFEPGVQAGAPQIAATASDLLLWLYRRVELALEPPAPDLVARFRALCFTD